LFLRYREKYAGIATLHKNYAATKHAQYRGSSLLRDDEFQMHHTSVSVQPPRNTIFKRSFWHPITHEAPLPHSVNFFREMQCCLVRDAVIERWKRATTETQS
jgi:hypothetical protein